MLCLCEILQIPKPQNSIEICILCKKTIINNLCCRVVHVKSRYATFASEMGVLTTFSCSGCNVGGKKTKVFCVSNTTNIATQISMNSSDKA